MLRSFVVGILFTLSAFAVAAEPTLEIPANLQPVNGYVTFVPKGDIKGVTYRGLSGVHPMPATLFANKLQFALPVERLPNGKYYFEAIGSLNDEHVVRRFYIVIGDSKEDDKIIPIPDDKKDDRKKEDKNEDKKEVIYERPLWIVIAEETSTRSPATARILNDVKFWDGLAEKGYNMRPYDVSTADARHRGYDKANDIPSMMVFTKEGIRVWDKWKPLPASGKVEDIPAMLPKVK